MVERSQGASQEKSWLMNELEQIKLKAYKNYKRYMIANGRGLYLSYYEWCKHVEQLITD